VAALIFLFSLTYHLISKLRGNEKNPQMNTYGIGLTVLGLVNMAISFTTVTTYFYLNEEFLKWSHDH